MKKIVSLILAGLMSVSLFAIGASAEKQTVVGAGDGVGTFDQTNKGGDINVKVEKVTHKYAVDLTFSFADLTIGNLEWNVNTMKYDLVNGTELKDTTRKITVDNRSDLPVYVYASIADVDKAPALSIGMTGAGSAVDQKLTVNKATAGTTGNGTAKTETLTVNLTSTDWNAVGLYYANKQLAADPETEKTITIATVTVYISKD